MPEKPVKIVYLINGLGSGGAEMMLYRLLERLDREVYLPGVVALLDLEGPVKNKIEALGIPVYVLKMKSKLDLPALYRLAKYLKVSKPDILQTQLFAADILGRVLGSLLKVPVIITSFRNSYYGGKGRDLLIKWTERFACRNTAVSHHAAQRFIDDKIIRKEKLTVIHNGLDPDTFFLDLNEHEKTLLKKELGLPEDLFLMLAVGSLTPQKGYALLLEALQEIKRGSRGAAFHLTVAGEGSLKEELCALTIKLGLTDNVSYLGRSDDVARLMAVADILVLSSHWEGLPGAVMEAMASGLPVVATAVGGTPELVVDGETGYLVPPGEAQKLAEALNKVLSFSVEKRKLFGTAGRARVKEHFSVDIMVESYSRLYLECLQEKKNID